MKKIAVVGYKGKMGQPIFLALKKKYQVIGIGRDNCLDDYDVDLVVDVASAESSVVSAEFAMKRGIPVIIGSTGQSAEQNKRINEISKKIKIIKKANFSQGIDVIKTMFEKVLQLNPNKVEIIEKHHINKKDSPSGTALDLKDFIAQNYSGCVNINSIREGDEKGEHIINATFDNEEISIKHNVFSRQAFVDGVIEEVKRILQ